MMEHMKINGIRLNKNYIQVTQKGIKKQGKSCVPLYQTLESNRINMVFMVLSTMDNTPFVSGSIASKHFEQIARQGEYRDHLQKVCTISIYPHHYKLQLLGFVLSLIGKGKLPFLHLVSSNAMLTFVIDQKNCDAFIDTLSANFNLPCSHVPFEQEENEELTQFLKKKYPETRATYVEKKIKTYGITLLADLILGSYSFSFNRLSEFGQKLKSLENESDQFFHTSVYMNSRDQIHLFLLTQKALWARADQTCKAELLSFQGPHFGDRHSIISRALNCLSKNKIPVLLAGCTGASIGIVLPENMGEKARHALTDVFEIP